MQFRRPAPDDSLDIARRSISLRPGDQLGQFRCARSGSQKSSMHLLAISLALPVRMRTASEPSLNRCAIFVSGMITGRPIARNSGIFPGSLRSSNASSCPGCTKTSAMANKSGNSFLGNNPRSLIADAVSPGIFGKKSKGFQPDRSNRHG